MSGKPMNPHDKKMEKDFLKKFWWRYQDDKDAKDSVNKFSAEECKEILDFLLQNNKKQREELVSEIEGMKVELPSKGCYCVKYRVCDGCLWNEGWNKALTDLNNKLK